MDEAGDKWLIGHHLVFGILAVSYSEPVHFLSVEVVHHLASIVILVRAEFELVCVFADNEEEVSFQFFLQIVDEAQILCVTAQVVYKEMMHTHY